MAETQIGQYDRSLVLFLAFSNKDILGSRDEVRLSSSSHTVKASGARPAWISAAAASRHNSGIQGPVEEVGGGNWKREGGDSVLKWHDTIPELTTMQGELVPQGDQ